MSDIPRQSKPAGWKQKLKHEFVEYWFNFFFLACFLITFAWYRRLILASYHIHAFEWGLPLIEAAILAKLIMIGDILRMGKRMQNRPLIVTTLYRTAVYGVFVGCFTILEHLVGALFHGKSLVDGLAEMTGKGIYTLLAHSFLVVVALFPFFAFKELERAFGGKKLRTLFLQGRAPSATSAPAAPDS